MGNFDITVKGGKAILTRKGKGAVTVVGEPPAEDVVEAGPEASAARRPKVGEA